MVTKRLAQLQFHLTSLRLHTNARLTFSQDNVTLKADSIHLSKGARITTEANMKFLNITATNIILDHQAKVTSDFGGFLGGPGAAQNLGSGGGHGGDVGDPREEPRTDRYLNHYIMAVVTALVVVELFLLTSQKR